MSFIRKDEAGGVGCGVWGVGLDHRNSITFSLALVLSSVVAPSIPSQIISDQRKNFLLFTQEMVFDWPTLLARSAGGQDQAAVLNMQQYFY